MIFRVLKDRSPAVFQGPGGLGRSGRLTGSTSTDPGTYKSLWLRVMGKKPRINLRKYKKNLEENIGQTYEICTVGVYSRCG